EVHELVSTQQLRTVEIGYRGNPRNKNLRESLMLTGDQSIVDMQFAMQFRISSPRDYLFNNDLGGQPGEIVRQAGETAMREVVGRSGIDRVLYEEKDLVARDALALVQSILDRKTTRLNSSHAKSSYAVFCLKRKKSCAARMKSDIRAG